jgi:D-proline reductase (dithiol) PrdB
MNDASHTVDGFKFLPPGLAAWIQTFIPQEAFAGDIPWTPLSKPLHQATCSLITSAGISCKTDPPFDMERELAEPTWGDRSMRVIPRETSAEAIDVKHLHINTGYVEADINVMLPLARMAEFEAEGIIGRLAPSAYSFYGFQWQNTTFLETAIAPMAEQMRREDVDVVLLTPA